MAQVTYLISEPPYGTETASEAMRSAVGQTVENDITVIFVGSGVESARALHAGHEAIADTAGVKELTEYVSTLADLGSIYYEQRALRQRAIDPPGIGTPATVDEINRIVTQSKATITF